MLQGGSILRRVGVRQVPNFILYHTLKNLSSNFRNFFKKIFFLNFKKTIDKPNKKCYNLLVNQTSEVNKLWNYKDLKMEFMQLLWIDM